MATSFRHWMQRQPHPATFRWTDEDGEERDIKLGIGRKKWSDVERITGPDPAFVEALDADGSTLRTFGEIEKPERSTNKELVELARIISDAHDKGAARCEGAYQLGFSNLVAITNAMSARLQMLEKVYTDLIMSQAPEAEGGMDAIMEQIVASRFGVSRKRRTMDAPAEPTNGAGNAHT